MKTYGVYVDETIDNQQLEYKEPKFIVEGKTPLEAYRKAFAELGYTLFEINEKI